MLIYKSTREEEGFLQFAPNFILSKEKAVECGMKEFFDSCQNIARSINSMGGIHEEELLILKALMLVNSNNIIEQSDGQKELKDNLLSLLTICSASLSGSSADFSMLHTQNLLLLLPRISKTDVIMRGMFKELNEQIDPRNYFLIEMIHY